MSMDIHYRHEWKHEITWSDLLAIRARLYAVAERDPHAEDGCYHIRSLYFDNLNDRALREKIDGVNRREKFRIRYYNGDTSFIKLEKKSKLNGLETKYSAPLTKEEAQKIVDGDIGFMMDSPDSLVRELYCKMRYQCLRPKTIVDYTRQPFIYRPGNVRRRANPHGGKVGRVPSGDHPRCRADAGEESDGIFKICPMQSIRVSEFHIPAFFLHHAGYEAPFHLRGAARTPRRS